MTWTSVGQLRATEHQLLTVEDVAALCSVSRRTVYRWIASDDLPVHRIPGHGARGILRIAKEDLDTWLAQYRHEFTTEKAEQERTLTLDGRRFIHDQPRKSVDSGKIPASRVPSRRVAG